MRRALIVVCLLTACADDPASGPGVNSHVEYYDIPGHAPPAIDVLVVLDDTTAMEPYQSALASLPAAVAADLDDPAGTQPDTRIFVTTTAGDGTLRQPSTTPADQPYLALSYDAHLARLTNFTGTFTDRLAELTAVGAARTGAVEPLEAARAALTAHADLLRASSYVGVVTITASDDASPSPVADYVTFLKGLTPDPGRVAVSGFYAMPADRLDMFHGSFPNRSTTADITTTDFGDALGLLAYVKSVLLGDSCVTEPADVDAVTPGPQYDCDLRAYYDDGTSTAVRACAADFTGPCFELLADPAYCIEGLRVALHGFPTQYFPPIRGQCVVPGA